MAHVFLDCVVISEAKARGFQSTGSRRQRSTARKVIGTLVGGFLIGAATGAAVGAILGYKFF